MFVPQGEAENSDGQRFLAKDGAQLLVFGTNNALDESLKQRLLDTARLLGASGKVTYKVLKPTWFVVSGENDDTDFYAKTYYRRGQFKSFELTYEHSVAAMYELLIGRIVGCFTDLGR